MLATSSAASSTSETLQQRIQERAYAIWEGQGKPHGCDLEHWLQAEAEIAASVRDTTTSDPDAKKGYRQVAKRRGTKS